MTIKEPPNGAGRHMQAVLLPQQIDQLHQSDIHLYRDGAEDHVAVCLDAMGALIPALWLSPCRPRRLERPYPADSRRNTDAEPLRGRTPR